ncbi:MAG: 3-phosphoshikimate 1-carboxyvinyltransferase [Dehalococcoidia bacterium]|nr:3-phosphoshikimate 1-carboxyvinyltransferase [Dehalococcoidia bacterium]
MERRVSSPRSLQGEVTVPGDKSISHRAVLFNALADGSAHIRNFAPGQDCRSTVACLRNLGVAVEEPRPGVLVVHGVGLPGLAEPPDVLDAGNSGTTIRLLTGVLAAQPFLSVVTGDGSLRSRPMGRIIQPLRLMGAQIWARGGDSLAPLAIHGRPLQGVRHRLPVASAQLKSCLLLAGLFATGETVVEEPVASRDHTERLLRAMGADLSSQGNAVTVRPAKALRPLDIEVPGDISSAAAWLVAGAVHPHARVTIKGVGVNSTRTGIIDILREMGARITLSGQRDVGGEPVADLTVESSALRGHEEIAGALIPRAIDELPLVALAACFATGKTTIRDAQELRVKESDRVAVTAQELRRLGARIEERPDGMVVQGPTPLRGALGESHGDHRLAMLLGVAGALASGETVVSGADDVAVSYPGFWDDLASLSR